MSLLAVLFVAGTYAAPWLASRGHDAGSWLHLSYGSLCHQIPGRSIEIAGCHQAVCARCSGLYLGGIVGLVGAALLVVGRGRRVAPWTFFALMAPTIVDAALPWVGLPQLANVPRLLLALPAGAIAGVFLAIGLGDILASARGAPRPTPTFGARSIHARTGS